RVMAGAGAIVIDSVATPAIEHGVAWRWANADPGFVAPATESRDHHHWYLDDRLGHPCGGPAWLHRVGGTQSSAPGFRYSLARPTGAAGRALGGRADAGRRCAGNGDVPLDRPASGDAFGDPGWAGRGVVAAADNKPCHDRAVCLADGGGAAQADFLAGSADPVDACAVCRPGHGPARRHGASHP